MPLCSTRLSKALFATEAWTATPGRGRFLISALHGSG
jgi:hypothetical protein